MLVYLRRSAYLVMIAGFGCLVGMLVSINGAVSILWVGSGVPFFWGSLALFIITPATLGSYICRALRLAVVFHPKAKRALPWLIPVFVVLCLRGFGWPW